MAVRQSQKLNLECRRCGYGVVSRAAPDRCPMCQRRDIWVHAPWRPFRDGAAGEQLRL